MKSIFLHLSGRLSFSLFAIMICLVIPNKSSFAQAVTYYQTGEEFSGPFPSWKNVKTDFGAMGDGVTNDAPAINAALLAMKHTGTNNYNVLYFPAGTYLIDDTLYNANRVLGDDYSGVQIIGEDPATTILKWNGPNFGQMLVINGWYMRVSRFTFDGNGTAAWGIFHTGGFSTGCEWSDLWFTNFNPVFSVGLDFSAPANGQAENAILRCRFTGVKYGVQSCNWNSLDQWVWNCLFADCHAAINQCTGYCQMYGNVFLRSVWYDISGSPYKNVMVNNTSINSAMFHQTQDGYLRGNKIYSNISNDSFYTSAGSALIDNVIRVPNNIWPATRVRNGSNMVIGNTMSKTNAIWPYWPMQPPYQQFDHGVGGSYAIGKQIEKAIDNNPATSFATQYADGFGGIKWNCPMGTARTVKKYTVSAPPNSGGKSPSTFILHASNDWGYTWTTLDTEVNQTFTGGGGVHTYTITNTTPYAIYEFRPTVGNVSGWLEVNEFHLFDSLNNDLTTDNQGLLTGADEPWGMFYPLDNTVVDSSAIVVPTTVSLPAAPQNPHRTVFEVPTGTGDDGLAIQHKIDSAALLPLGSKPVVHIRNGLFNINHTIIVPAGSDMQIIGDGVGSGTITRLMWTGDTTGPLMHCLGPSRVTIKDMLLKVPYTNGVEPLVIEDADQVGGRIFGNQFHAGGMDVVHLGDVGMFADGVENSDITMICGGPGECLGAAIIAKGGAVLSAGGNTNGQISCLSGASGASQNLFSVVNGGRITAEGMWYEGYQPGQTDGLIDLENCSGKLSLACMAWYLDSTCHESIIHTKNFTGNLTLLLNHFNQIERSTCLMEGSGAGFSVLGAYNDWGQATTIGGTADSVWEDQTLPNANATFFSNTATTTLHNLDVVTNKVHGVRPDSTSLLNDLAQLRAVRTDPPMDRVPGVTDVKLFRVSTWGARRNAAAHFIGVPDSLPLTTTHVTKADYLVTLYPTVVRQNYTVRYELPETGAAWFTVYDILGRLISERNMMATRGINQSVFSVDGLSSGTYFLKFRSGTISETKRFIVTH